MSFETFENLELLPEILKTLQNINKRLDNLETEYYKNLDLTKKTSVAEYLNCTTKTIDNMINDGRLIEGVHFNKKIGKILFIESAIKSIKE